MPDNASAAAIGRTKRVAWSAILGLLAVDLLWLPFTRLTVAPLSLVMPVTAGVALAGLAHYYAAWRGEPKLAAALDCMGQIVAFSAIGALFSYLVVTPGLPMQDALLHRIDLALGFDWAAWLGWMNRHAWLAPALTLAYQSFMFQVITLILILCFTGRGLAARTMILGMILSGAVVITLSGLLPALSTFAFLNLSPADYPNLQPAAAFIHLGDLMALHAGTALHVDLTRAHGIITFPSYHAALGLIMLFAGWNHPWLRWPFTILNLAMIVATPIDGGHYFADVLGGLVIACAAHLVARRLSEPVRGRQLEPVFAGGSVVLVKS